MLEAGASCDCALMRMMPRGQANAGGWGTMMMMTPMPRGQANAGGWDIAIAAAAGGGGSEH